MARVNFPILYHKSKGGKLHSWEVWAEGDTVTVSAGTVDGKKTITSKKVIQKNIGKKNETSLEDQASKEAKAQWTYKVERKYSETMTGAQEELFLPMLADDFQKKKAKIVWADGVDIQPKLDGVRCLAHWEDGKIVLTSRNGLEWVAVPHINIALEKLLPKDSVFDGELYIHGKNFQEITRRVKKLKPESAEIEYHVYDMPTCSGDGSLPWRERHAELKGAFKFRNTGTFIKLVETINVKSEDEAIALHDNFVKDGYEGGIVRLWAGLYLYGYRSKELLKIKQFEDAEFEVISYHKGVGRYENSVIWVCKTEAGSEFRVNPKISIAEKEEFLKRADDYIGSLLKVRFFGRSEDGNPRFPVGIGFRLDQDMS